MKKKFALAALLALFCTVSFAQEEWGNVSKNKVTLTEIPPVWPGCEENKGDRAAMNKCFTTQLSKHISSNFKYPAEAYNNNDQGRVVVDFKINTEGKVEIISTSGASQILQEEAKRNIMLIPQMKPGMLGGKPKEITYKVPFTFKTGKS